MSIARLKKVTICGLLTEKRELLEGLQELGCMHLLPLRPAPAEVEKIASPRAEGAYKALRFLTDMPEKRKQVRRDPNFDVDKVVHEALAIKDRLRDVSDRRDFLENRTAAIEPWGDIVFPPHADLAGYRLWFYMLPLGKTAALHDVDLPWEIVRKDHRFAYVVVIARDEPPGELLPVPRTHTGALPLEKLKEELEQTEVDIEDAIGERHALTRYIYLLSVNLAEAENRAGLAHADQQTRDEDGIVAVQGWVPEDALEGVEAFVEEKGIACLFENPGPDEEPPTLIEQPPDMKAGAVLSVSYTVPTYRMWDPSVVLFFSFSLFFAMILADAGYAAVLMAGLAVFWKRLGQNENSRATRIMLFTLFAFAIVYGIMSGGYFGINPPAGSVLAVFQVINLNDYGSAMKLSIIVGVLHLVLANAMVAFLNRTRTTAFANLGWIAGLIGGVTVTYSETGGFFSLVGFILLIGGLVGIFLFTSERPIVNRPIDYLWRVLDGFKALTGVMGAFGDVLSYLRLFALGLASASLAATFNNLAVQANDGIPGLGLLFAILILILGHTVTLALGIMSGVVHGLRLNFIEFYKWGMPGEGSVFRKFARKEVQP